MKKLSRNRWKYSPLSLALVGLLAACNGGDDEPASLSGKLIDAAVEGVAYTASPSGVAGTTGADGTFNCKQGDLVRFKLGDVDLGTGLCTPRVMLSDLALTSDLSKPQLVNRLVLLQLLDEDDDASNGIRIPAAVADAFKGKSLDFSLAPAAFEAALKPLLPAASDAFGQSYASRNLGELRRIASAEHYESTLAGELGQVSTSKSSQATAGGEVLITKYELQAEASMFVPYEGTNTAAKKDFPKGFYPAVGSGLAFKGKTAEGKLEFWGITDRGPNGDSPNAPRPDLPASVSITKMFPAPSFTPSIGVISVGSGGARIASLMPLKSDANTRITGRPAPFGVVGSSLEIPLDDGLRYDGAKGGFDAKGLDSESLVYDEANKVFWTSDEYGPFIVKIDAATGVILKRYEPGAGAGKLPAVLAQRRSNRGMEGLAQDKASGKLHGFLQSPIDPLDGAGKSIEVTDSFDMDKDGKSNDKVKVRDFAQFARWLEFDPKTETSRLFAYPLDYALAGKGETWDRNRTGSAKLGDLVSLGNGRFIVIEQGADANGLVRNFLMLVELPANATDITALGIELEKNSIDGTTAVATPWKQVVKLKKTVLLDLNAAGWKAEKAEGLSLVDEQTLALINDNDFGLRTSLVDAGGKLIEGDPTACTVDINGVIVNDGACTPGAVGVRVARGNEVDRKTRLWLLKFPKALASYTLP
ncbi:esterase-like activity of phytase family protein [Pelomonas sp. SE-A7]|uniref:esterase-like activity of phytase family protein n=1 Tax=Pelomonas sp. SE-A7 TaxID=3054953 RepID=UPI00259CE069|nr:esterase-like activity of phytase family protein [Pelomonas sp. SE-A7]MDM4768526.1 esterase-like activity of phytase family protein [Pelomonas sp. SE-A7]